MKPLSRLLHHQDSKLRRNLTQLPAPAPAAPQKKKNKLDPDEDEEVDESQVGMGSIAAAIGGGYDSLVAMFTAAAAGDGKKAASLPCIGLSIGLDRIFALLLPKWVKLRPRANHTSPQPLFYRACSVEIVGYPWSAQCRVLWWARWRKRYSARVPDLVCRLQVRMPRPVRVLCGLQ